MPKQMPLPFGVKPALGKSDFIVAPCNEAALRFIESWPEWPARAGAIYGPKGCGKTHLAEVWAERAGATVVPDEDPDAVAFLERLAALDIPIVVDGLHDPSERRDRALIALFERPRGFLLLADRTPPTEWKVVVGDLRSRFDSLLAFAMWASDETLLGGVLRKHFADRQLDIPENMIGRVLARLERTPEAIAKFVARADSKALAEKRGISERLIQELLEEDDNSAR